MFEKHVNNERSFITKSLLRKDRLDFVIKYFYVWARVNGQNIKLATDMYREHIISVTKGVCIEPDQPWKNSVDKYLDSFNQLIDSVQKDGLIKGEKFSEIGAHRVACLMFFYDEFSTTEEEYRLFFLNTDICFDYAFFCHTQFPSNYLECVLIMYDEISQNIFNGFEDVVEEKYLSEKKRDISQYFYYIKYFLRRILVKLLINVTRIPFFKGLFSTFKYSA